MDAKEVKNTLKNAREAIRKKEFKDALKHCKSILAQDKNHYMALVLVGVSAEGLDQPDQAVKAYKRAIETDSEQLLAWQGLSGFYEKNPPKDKNDMIQVYEKLSKILSGEREKREEVMKKLTQLYVGNAEIEKAVQIYSDMIKEERDIEQKQKQLESAILLLWKQTVLSQPLKDQLLSFCSTYLESGPTGGENLEKIIKSYLALLMKENDSEFCVKCENLLSRYPQSVSCLENSLICIMDQMMVRPGKEVYEKLATRVELLQQHTETSPYLTACLGCAALQRRDLPGACKLLVQAFQLCPNMACVMYHLGVAQLGLHDNTNAEESCDAGLRMLQKKDRILTVFASEALSSLHLLLAKVLYRQGTPHALSRAVTVIEENLDTSKEEIRLLLGFIRLKTGDTAGAENCVCGSGPYTEALGGTIALQKGDYQTAVEKLKSALDKTAEDSETLLTLGKCYWAMRDIDQKAKELCFSTLLKAAKLDPYQSETFQYLGQFYNEIQGDPTRARKCYQKAYDLDRSNEEAGAALCDLLVSLDIEEEAHVLLVKVTSEASAGSAKWAWLRLGLYQVKHDNPSVAVASFQAALRADPKDNHVWECLAEAYLHRGSYTAALKAFTKASELDPDSMYSYFQIAAIKQTLGVYTEAIDEYKSILEKSPNYVPALKGLGETYLLQARSKLQQFMNGKGRDMAEQALSYLTRAATHRPDLSCLWKLLGDSCTIMHSLAAENFKLEVPSKLMKKESKDVKGSVSVNKLEALQLGGRCYGQALKILPDSASLWHDLGVNYFYQSQCLTGEALISLAERSAQALKKAISLDANNYKHWNALGVLACFEGYDQPDLAQHCFIKSIKVEANNVVAWTNLATLYFKHDRVNLAHEAFKVAQSLEPSYVACWIGQAMIAEVVGHEDAMDLFRHTTELGNHVEGAIGYAHWVCSLLQNPAKQQTEIYRYAIEQMSAIPAASDALARYTDRVKTNPWAFNMHGLLLEHQKLYRSAAEAFGKCVSLLEEDGFEDKKLQLAQIRCNFARVLCKLGEYEAALGQYNLVDNVDQFVDVCQLGLALYKSGQLKQSFQVYTRAADLTSSSAEKSHVYAALAMVSYKFGDLKDTKTSLFQSSQMSPPSLWGLEALFAVGLLQSDVTLATAAAEELFKAVGTGDYSAEVTLVYVALSILQGKVLEAKNWIQKVLHKDPTLACQWRLLAEVLTRYHPNSGQAVASCARCSLTVGVDKDCVTLIPVGQLMAGYHDNRDRNNNAFISSQKAVHLYPEKVETSITLIAAIHSEAVLTETEERRKALFDVELQYLNNVYTENLNMPLKLWVQKQKVILAVHSGRFQEAKQLLQNTCNSFPSSQDGAEFCEMFSAVLQQDVNAVAASVTKYNKLYYWQLLIDMYITCGLKQEMDTAVKLCLQNATSDSSRQVQISTLIKLAYFAFREITSKRDDVDVELMRSIFEEAMEEIYRVAPHCTAVGLMQGILNIAENSRLAKHQLQGLLDQCHMTHSRGHDLSLARQALIYILWTSKKDIEVIKAVVLKATDAGDQSTVDYYNKLCKTEQ